MQSAELLRLAAIGLALLGALALAIGAQLQNDAVTKHHTPQIQRFTSLGPSQLLNLLRRPRWMIGTAVLGLAIVFQLSALALAPLMVVQPVGAVALVVTALLNASIYKLKLDGLTWVAIYTTLAGIAAFVLVAANIAIEVDIDEAKLLRVVALLLVALVGFAALFLISRGRVRPLNYIIGAGVLFGFVVSLAKVIIVRISQLQIDVLTLVAALALLVAVLLGLWFVQNAYASGPPELVIAGLTVIDPAIAVAIAIIVLQEAQDADPVMLAALLGFAAIAMVGVMMLSRFHPDLRRASQHD